MFKRFEKNLIGKDYVCGDLHGCFSMLEKELKKIHFNFKIDRLFCVGDLADRGPESKFALYYLRKPWFYSVLGNHEDIFLQCHRDKTSDFSWHLRNGGEWLIHESEEWIEEYIEEIEKLPLAIQVGDIGIVHARTPEGVNWNTVISNLDDPDIRKTLLWGRHDSPKVDDIKVIYAGHTINELITYYGSIKDIDTGAYFQYYNYSYGKLSICEL